MFHNFAMQNADLLHLKRIQHSQIVRRNCGGLFSDIANSKINIGKEKKSYGWDCRLTSFYANRHDIMLKQFS